MELAERSHASTDLMQALDPHEAGDLARAEDACDRFGAVGELEGVWSRVDYLSDQVDLLNGVQKGAEVRLMFFGRLVGQFSRISRTAHLKVMHPEDSSPIREAYRRHESAPELTTEAALLDTLDICLADGN